MSAKFHGRFSLILISIHIVLSYLFLCFPSVTNAQKNNDKFKVGIDFNNVEIRIFIDFIADMTRKNFIIDERVKGKVTVKTSAGIPYDEVYSYFLSTLDLHGYTTVPDGAFIKIIPKKRPVQIWSKRLLPLLVFHMLFWIVLIFMYPKSKKIQAIFFWNPFPRKILGLGYINALLVWTPFLQRILFSPFRKILISDALPKIVPAADFFDRCYVLIKKSGKIRIISEEIPEIKGHIVLEGDSGLGKTTYLARLIKKSKRVVVYLPAMSCSKGVIDAIQRKLHGSLEDVGFLKRLIYSGAVDICIDGLNEVTAGVRANIKQFVESYPEGNVIMATQPVDFAPPVNARVYAIQPLNRDQIKEFLLLRKSAVIKNYTISEDEYSKRCKEFLLKALSPELPENLRNVNQSIISNPMDLTVITDLLGLGENPNLSQLQKQQFDIMDREYQHVNFKRKFPIRELSERVYEMRINNIVSLAEDEFPDEVYFLERHKMLVSRKQKTANGHCKTRYHFRHDRISDFFVLHKFLLDQDVCAKHIGDPRFMGVYFMLASVLPLEPAMELREKLILYAANTKDHTVSDTFIKLLATRKSHNISKENI